MSLFLLTAILLAAAGMAAFVMYLVRRTLPKDRSILGDSDLGSTTFAYVGTAFAVLAAFVIVEAYDGYNEAREGVESEALAVIEMTRTADLFEAEDSNTLTGLLVCYGRAVVYDEWPLMEQGVEGSALASDWVERFRAATGGVEVGTRIQEAAFLQLLTEQDRRIEGRRERLHEATRELPPPVWAILALGGLLTVGWVLLFADRREHFAAQASVIGAVAASTAASLLLVWFLDHPYEDSAGSIRPTEMTEALEIVLEEHPLIKPPCDEAGGVASAAA